MRLPSKYLAPCLALLMAAGCGGGSSSSGGRASGPPGNGREAAPDSTALARDLTRRIAQPWPDLQDRFGRYENPLGGYTRYGEAVLGYSLLETGLREKDRRLVRSGIRAITFSTEKLPYEKAESHFERLAVTLAYERARKDLSKDRAFRKNRWRWERFLRGVKLSRLPNQSFYGNHWLVEAVYTLELQSTGLRSDDPQSIVGGDRRRSRALAIDLINRKLVRLMRDNTVRAGGRKTLLLSDPPENPLPYQGLSLGLYARAIRLMGKAATSEAREVLRRAANASYELIAPDGQTGYWGRNQDEAFGQALTVYGVRMAADLPGSSASDDARYEAVARRSLARLRSEYIGGRYGMSITPSLRKGYSDQAASGLDSSAGGPSFTGLALMGLNWALDEGSTTGTRPASALSADRDGATVLGTGPSRFAVVRRGPLWWVIKSSAGAGRIRDLRFDFGLQSLKDRDRSGRWEDVVPLRPYTKDAPDSAGPVLLNGGTRALPYTTDIAAGRGGRVTAVGGFVPGGGAPLRTGVSFRWVPRGCGVRLTFPARAGDSFEYSAFFREGNGPPEITEQSVADGWQIVRFTPRASVTLEPGYSSASDPNITRARLNWTVKRDERIRVAVCPSGAR